MTPGYQIFLARLVQARYDRGLTIPELADRLGLPVPLVEKYENGELPLDVLQTRSWVSALDVPIVAFTQALDDELASTLDRDEAIVGEIAPDVTIETASDETDEEDPPKEPRIEVLVFQPGHAPEIRIIDNDLSTMQSIVEGLITVVHIEVPNCVAVANDEAILLGMPLNVKVPATQSAIFGPFFVALDTPPNFGSLSPREVELVLDALAGNLSQTQYRNVVLSHSRGKEWVESWE